MSNEESNYLFCEEKNNSYKKFIKINQKNLTM